MGGDDSGVTRVVGDIQLKSTPPAWAGTADGGLVAVQLKLKSTPPAWAGTPVHCKLWLLHVA